jgi:hypothetical protein
MPQTVQAWRLLLLRLAGVAVLLAASAVVPRHAASLQGQQQQQRL